MTLICLFAFWLVLFLTTVVLPFLKFLILKLKTFLLCCPPPIRFVHVGSAGVTRPDRPGLDLNLQPPAVRMNKELGGILTFKLKVLDSLEFLQFQLKYFHDLNLLKLPLPPGRRSHPRKWNPIYNCEAMCPHRRASWSRSHF